MMHIAKIVLASFQEKEGFYWEERISIKINYDLVMAMK
jgi:hypothetical protein